MSLIGSVLFRRFHCNTIVLYWCLYVYTCDIPLYTQQITTQSSAEEEVKLDEAISCLESYDLRSSCVKFVNGVRDLETSIKAVKEQISLIRTPRVPDLEQVHGYIDQCQVNGYSRYCSF